MGDVELHWAEEESLKKDWDGIQVLGVKAYSLHRRRRRVSSRDIREVLGQLE